MNIGKVNCQVLAHEVCSILGDWRVINEDNPEAWAAGIQRSDGLCLWITETKTSGKNPMVEVSLDYYKSIPGLSRNDYMRADVHAVKCEGRPSSVAPAIRVRLIEDAERDFFKVRDEKEKEDRRIENNVNVLTELGQAIGYLPRGRDGQVERGEGYVSYNRDALSLTLKFTGYKNSFHLDGYCNYIPVDLMYRLIPVIEKWYIEKNTPLEEVLESEYQDHLETLRCLRAGSVQ